MEQQPAFDFQLPDSNYDPSFQPQNGYEYLQKVVYERTLHPEIVVKPLGEGKMVQIDWNQFSREEIPDISPTSLRPTEEWKNIQIDTFTRLQSYVQDLRERNALNEQIGDEETKLIELPDIDEQTEWFEFCRTNNPRLIIMLQIDQRSLETLIEYQMEWLKDDSNPVNLSDTDNWLGQWIYSSLACLRKPIEPNMHSVLRYIARTCITLRNELQSNDLDKVLPLNLLISIIAVSFNQLDLSERT